ncbi:TPA: ThiF family adenylyltransferase [Streptococcus equi subsp. zooepidemicus]|uniref:ThiF family adenylyltransferase n=1 Tax=Streptococcus equi TaxID=1336 RepID=UPI000DA3E22F|nr:ThiF family adenylyltransferase [Streptococcus equi]SQF80739.1 HesA/MoeB/ThiF family protein [Streptococcus equi subsp. zooepidemicus]HEL0560571.1 ThiF family adenylyltransferase [Streptococcus equi subsp. zooepidemicus]
MNNFFPKWNQDRIVYSWQNDKLRIGADDNDVLEIKGNSIFWSDFISCCDGDNSIKDIQKLLNIKYNISEEIITEYLDKFSNRNLLEILDNPINQLQDYKSIESLETYYASEGIGGIKLLKMLGNLKISILGCGGGGSHIALQLAQLGVGRIHLVDYDIVEENNINRQSMFTFNDVGNYKVDCVAKNIQQRSSKCLVTKSTSKMINVPDVKKEISESDWVFCCMDEPPYIAQRIVNRACYLLKIPSIYCFSQRSAGKLLFCNPNIEDSGCIDCLLSEQDNENFQKLVTTFTTYNRKLVTANILPNILLLTSWVVKRWLDCVTDKNSNVWNMLLRFDFYKYMEEKFQYFSKQDSCPTCAKGLSTSKLWEILKIDE